MFLLGKAFSSAVNVQLNRGENSDGEKRVQRNTTNMVELDRKRSARLSEPAGEDGPARPVGSGSLVS